MKRFSVYCVEKSVVWNEFTGLDIRYWRKSRRNGESHKSKGLKRLLKRSFALVHMSRNTSPFPISKDTVGS
jgi:hypothetical protein